MFKPKKYYAIDTDSKLIIDAGWYRAQDAKECHILDNFKIMSGKKLTDMNIVEYTIIRYVDECHYQLRTTDAQNKLEKIYIPAKNDYQVLFDAKRALWSLYPKAVIVPMIERGYNTSLINLYLVIHKNRIEPNRTTLAFEVWKLIDVW